MDYFDRGAKHQQPTVHATTVPNGWGHYAVFTMGPYTLSCELAAGWEIAARLTLSLSVFTQLAACAHYSTTTPNFTRWKWRTCCCCWTATTDKKITFHRGCVWGNCEHTICCSAGRRLQGGCDASVRAAVGPESGQSGCLTERGGGQTGGPLLRCGQSYRRGAAPEVAGRGIRDVSCAETQGIPFLEKQSSVNSSARADAFREKDSDENLLQAAEVHPVLTVTINPTGASAKKQWSHIT